MSITRSQSKKQQPQPTRAALKDKYKNIKSNSNSVIAIINQESEAGPSVSVGPVRLPRDVLHSLSGSNIKWSTSSTTDVL